MRKSGALQTWNDDRGFGFISPLEGDMQIFVHISAFPKDGSRPTIGEKLTYLESFGRDGRPRATEVERTAFPGSRTPKAETRDKTNAGSWLGSLVAVVLISIALASGYQWYKAYTHRLRLEAQPASSVTQAQHAATSSSGFTCDGRTHCSQMSSCAEATWFINNCPGTQMDGNHDGVPCEQQWCNGPTIR